MTSHEQLGGQSDDDPITEGGIEQTERVVAGLKAMGVDPATQTPEAMPSDKYDQITYMTEIAQRLGQTTSYQGWSN